METYVRAQTKPRDSVLKNFLKGMETQRSFFYLLTTARLKNFLKGMETRVQSSPVPSFGILKNFLKGMETWPGASKDNRSGLPQKLP